MSSPFSIGDIVNGRYRLVAPIVSSPTANVFRADDLSLTRPVAIHVAPFSLHNDAVFLESFREEATAAAALNHPHVLRVYDWGEEAGGAYLVTEFPVGGTLRSVLDRDGTMRESVVALMGLELADGLAYAHARGIVHGALSPATIHFDADGRSKVADFGFAAAIAKSHIGPSTDIRYASPEQAQRQAVDGKTDVYALSLILFEAITGTIPHEMNSPAETLSARIGTPLPSDPRIRLLDMVLAQAGAYDTKFRLDAASLTTRLQATVGALSSSASNTASMAPASVVPTDATRVTKRPALGFQTPTSSDVLTGETAPVPPSTLIEGIESVRSSGEVPMSDFENYRPAARSKRSWLRPALAITLFLVTAGLVGAYATGMFKPAHTVPSVLGLTQQQALSLVSDSNFKLEITGRSFSTTVDDGKIASQTPDAGTSLQEGESLSVTISQGAPPVAIPTNIIGMDCAAATQALEKVGLKADCPTSAAIKSTKVRAGRVIKVTYESQTNPASVPKGATVTLVLSLGNGAAPSTTSTTSTTQPANGHSPRPVPDVVGKNRTEVFALMHTAELYFVTTGPGSQNGTWHTVVSQSPAPGTSIKWHGTVRTTVK
jgi:serine/threonine-protein kinase